MRTLPLMMLPIALLACTPCPMTEGEVTGVIELRGRPAAGATVYANYPGNPAWPVRTTADADGEYTLSLPAGGEWTVSFVHSVDTFDASCWSSWFLELPACEASGTVDLEEGRVDTVCS